jgi:hypothetical protein
LEASFLQFRKMIAMSAYLRIAGFGHRRWFERTSVDDG